MHYGLSNSEYVNERFSRDCRCSDIVTDHVVDNDRATRYKDDSHLLQSYDSRDELDDDYLMLLLPIVEAFMLEKKTWNLLSVDDIKDPKGRDVRKQADFTDLILPEGHEYLLKALVRAHPSTKLLTSEDHSKSGKPKTHLKLMNLPTDIGNFRSGNSPPWTKRHGKMSHSQSSLLLFQQITIYNQQIRLWLKHMGCWARACYSFSESQEMELHSCNSGCRE